MSWSAWLLSWFGFAEFTGPSIDFTFTVTGDSMAAGTGIIKVTDSNSLLTIAAMPGTYAVGGNPPVSFDAIAGPVSVACNEGDTIKIDVQAISKGGVASPTTTVTVEAIDKATAPAAPGVDFSFTVNAAPTPAPAPAAS